MNKEEIQQVLPHREPMLLIKKTSLDADGNAHAWATIPSDAFYCQGHFPGNPIVPGVVLAELARVCAEERFHCSLELVELDSCRFRRPVPAGDSVEVTLTAEEADPPEISLRASVTVGGGAACQLRMKVRRI